MVSLWYPYGWQDQQPGRNPTLVFITLGEALPDLKRSDEPTKALSYSRAAFKPNDEVDQQHAFTPSLSSYKIVSLPTRSLYLASHTLSNYGANRNLLVLLPYW